MWSGTASRGTIQSSQRRFGVDVGGDEDPGPRTQYRGNEARKGPLAACDPELEVQSVLGCQPKEPHSVCRASGCLPWESGERSRG